MPISRIDLRIKEGRLTLTDGRGQSASYRRVDSPFDPVTPHIACGESGCQALSALLEAGSFPKELIVKHEVPQEPAWAGGGNVVGAFRCVLDEQ
jgi:hypothetical protein